MFIKEILGINELISLYPEIYTPGKTHRERHTQLRVRVFLCASSLNGKQGSDILEGGKKHHYSLEMF